MKPQKRIGSANKNISRKRPLHPRERKEIEEKTGKAPLPRLSENKKHSVPSGTLEEKTEWLKTFWKENGLPPGAWTLPRSYPDPLDGGYGESYTTTQMHYGTYLLKALSKQRDARRELYLSPRHASLLQSLQEQLQKEHLPALRNSLTALHIRSSGERFHILLQCKKGSAAIIGAAKKFAAWAIREKSEIEGVHLILYDSPKPIPLGSVQPHIRWRTLEGEPHLSVEMPEWAHPLMVHPLEGGRGHRPLWGQMVSDLTDWLHLKEGDHLVDFCSGSGAFALEGARKGAAVSALDRKNGVGDFLFQNGRRLRVKLPRFVRGEFTSSITREIFEGSDGAGKVVIDLPGMATPAGVPTECARAEVVRIARIYGTPHQLVSEWGRWKHNGYMLHKVRSYDSRPGGPGLEFVALFRRIGTEGKGRLRKEKAPPKILGERGK